MLVASLVGFALLLLGAVTLECASPNVGAVSNHSVACLEYWGGHTDNVHPAIWFNGFSGQAILRGFHFSYEASGFKLGIDSTNNRNATNGGVTSLWFDQDAITVGACYSNIGAGPAVDIGGNSFWIKFNEGSYDGCPAEHYSITAISRTSNVVTVTINKSARNDIVANGVNWIIIRNVADQTFNGAYAIASTPTATTFTYAQTGPNASSRGGQAFPYGASAIGINSGTGSGSGVIYLNDVSVNSGAVWVQGGYNGVGININKLFYEGGGSPDMSVVELLPQIANGDTAVYVNDVEIADNTVPICGVESLGFHDPVLFANGNVSVENSSICGSMITPNGQSQNTVVTPGREGESGLINGRYVGFDNFGRRLFSPYAVRFPNLIGPSSNWNNVGGLTLANGIPAPDGTSGATRMINSTGSQNGVALGGTSGTPGVGNTFIFGAWIRTVTGTPPQLRFQFGYLGYGTGNYCSGSYYGSANPAAGAAYQCQPLQFHRETDNGTGIRGAARSLPIPAAAINCWR